MRVPEISAKRATAICLECNDLYRGNYSSVLHLGRGAKMRTAPLCTGAFRKRTGCRCRRPLLTALDPLLGPPAPAGRSWICPVVLTVFVLF